MVVGREGWDLAYIFIRKRYFALRLSDGLKSRKFLTGQAKDVAME